MAAQATAVLAGDEKAFVATVDPQQPDLFGLTASGRLGNHVTGPAGTAIKVNPNLVDVVSDTGILRHELTHYLLREYSGSNPKWLTEGVATWVEYYPDDFSALQAPATLYRSVMHADRGLSSIGLFNTDPAVNYPVSQAAVAPRLFRQVYGVNVAEVVEGAFTKLAELQH